MSHYRLYFMLDKQIKDFADLESASDAAAIERARELFSGSSERYSAFEIWQRARLVYTAAWGTVASTES